MAENVKTKIQQIRELNKLRVVERRVSVPTSYNDL